MRINFLKSIMNISGHELLFKKKKISKGLFFKIWSKYPFYPLFSPLLLFFIDIPEV